MDDKTAKEVADFFSMELDGSVCTLSKEAMVEIMRISADMDKHPGERVVSGMFMSDRERMK